MHNNLINFIAPLECEKICFHPKLKVLSIWQRIFNSDKTTNTREDFFEQTFEEKLFAGEKKT